MFAIFLLNVHTNHSANYSEVTMEEFSSPMHKPSNPKFFEIVFFVCFDSPGPNAHPDTA